MTKWNMIDTKENGKVAIESLDIIELAKEFDEKKLVNQVGYVNRYNDVFGLSSKAAKISSVLGYF